MAELQDTYFFNHLVESFSMEHFLRKSGIKCDLAMFAICKPTTSSHLHKIFDKFA